MSAPATLSWLEHSETAGKVCTLINTTPDGAIYRDLTRSLSLPFSVEFQYKIGAPGAKQNDHMIVLVKDSVVNSTTGVVSTASMRMDLSIPRDTTWTTTMSENILSGLGYLFCPLAAHVNSTYGPGNRVAFATGTLSYATA